MGGVRVVVGRRGLLEQELKERVGDVGGFEERGDVERMGGMGVLVECNEERELEELGGSRSRGGVLEGSGGAVPEFGAGDPEDEGVDTGLLVVVDNDEDRLSEEIAGEDQSFNLSQEDCMLMGRIEVKSSEDVGVFDGGGERGEK